MLIIEMAGIGYMPHQGKCLPLPGVSRGAIVLSYSCNRGQKLFCGIINVNPHKTRVSFMCNAGPNNFKRNPDFSRRQRGSSRGGKSKQYHEPEQPDNMEEMDYVSSKNGSLLSLTGNIRHQSTPLPGQREKEIVELFRKVQAQLRERAMIKEGKKIEAAQQGQNERGTVDSLLKLLRKHSVNQKKKSSTPEVDFVADQLEKNSTTLDDEQNLNHFAADDIDSDSSEESTPLVSTRPASYFRRKSPVPRVKFQPVLSAEEEAKSPPSKSQGRSKKIGNSGSELLKKAELLTVEHQDEEESEASDNQVETSDSNSTAEKTKESSATEASADLGSLKVAELRDLAKARGVKGYSKLKKGELIELLGA